MATILKEYENGAVDYAKTVITITNAANEVIDTITVPTDETYDVNVEVVANKTDFTEKGNFKMKGLYVNDSGIVTLQGSVQYLTRQRQAGMEAELFLASPNIQVRVTATPEVNWKCERIANIMEGESDVY